MHPHTKANYVPDSELWRCWGLRVSGRLCLQETPVVGRGWGSLRRESDSASVMREVFKVELTQTVVYLKMGRYLLVEEGEDI